METLKKQTNIGGDVLVERNRQILVETLKKQTNIGGDVKETYWWRRQRIRHILVEKYWWRRGETLKKQTNVRGDVKVTDKYSWRR